MKKFIYYLPRALTILIVAFFYLFVLEGFSPGFGWQDSLAHFILASIVLAIAILAWKYPKIGGGLFVLFGLRFFLPAALNGVWRTNLPITLPLILTGVLFLIEGFNKNKK